MKKDVVIGMADGVAAAKEFASATGRGFVGVENAAALLHELSRDYASVTLSGGSSITSRDLVAVTGAASRRCQAIGFIPGWAPKQAERFAEKMVRYRWRQDSSTLLWSHAGVGRLEEGNFGTIEYLGRDADVFQRLTVPRHAAFLVTHGNGIDAPVGRSVMCSALTPKLGSPLHDYLPCGYPGGPCFRSRLERGVLVDPHRIRPQDVAADVLMWSACYGVLTADAMFDPARSLAVDFVASPWVGALLSTYKDMEQRCGPRFWRFTCLGTEAPLGPSAVSSTG